MPARTFGGPVLQYLLLLAGQDDQQGRELRLRQALAARASSIMASWSRVPGAVWYTAKRWPSWSGVGGAYLEDCAPARAWTGEGSPPRGHYLPYALDAGRADRLWSLAERLVGPL